LWNPLNCPSARDQGVRRTVELAAKLRDKILARLAILEGTGGDGNFGHPYPSLSSRTAAQI
jgi:hypothetical protein